MQPPTDPVPAALDEAAARRIVLVRAFDATPGPLWTAEDGAWATRLAAQTTPADAPAVRFLAERARHAVERLAPRSTPVRRWLARSPRASPRTLAALLGVALALGLALPGLGPQAHIDLLAPPVWAVLAWNLLVYAALLGAKLRGRTPQTLRRGLQRWLLRRGDAASADPLARAFAAWAMASTPLAAARAAAWLHAASAALALGLIGGLYLRGLVFDLRAGWQSTFLDAQTVHAVLATLLAPAAALTGIGIPDAAAIETMRVTPAAPVAVASAAPWIHLYAAMLVLAVIGPRTLFAVAGGWRAGSLRRRFPLALDDAYFQDLLRRRQGGVARVQVLPHAAACSAGAALGLRALLASAYGDDVVVLPLPPTRIGEEEQPPPAASGLALRIVLVDLAATPEPETHGRFVQALRRQVPAAPLLLVADEAAFGRRFGAVAGRLDERRGAWADFARTHDLAWFAADLEAPDRQRDAARLGASLQRLPTADGPAP